MENNIHNAQTIENFNGLSASTAAAQFNPKRIYSTIINELETLFSELTGKKYKSEKIENALMNCYEQLNNIKINVNNKVAELEKNAEWDKFTIAFYGETNAGKSTIIETLRIYLSESTKLAEQDRFFKELDKLGISKDILENEQKTIDKLTQKITDFEAEFKIHNDTVKSELENISFKLTSQQQSVKNLLSTTSILKRLFFLIWPPKEIVDAKETAKELKLKTKKRSDEISTLSKQKSALIIEKESAEKNLEIIKAKWSSLNEFADGQIIGDGQSDFTKDTQAYQFETQFGNFILLDVPGIEGKEQIVIDKILKAVQKAHAVFYITSKAAPPQKGENGQSGTLEKIKTHLNDQTEVWTIFNKRITNPLQLNTKMISEDEQTSLNMLDTVMKKQLLNNYMGTVTISARAAFLAVAKCLVPFELNEKSKEKFLASYSSDTLIEKSGLNSLSLKISKEILTSFPEKIRIANFNKAITALNEAIVSINAHCENQIIPLIKDLKNSESAAIRQIEDAFNILNSDIDAETYRAIEFFKNSARQKIYEKIENDINNDVFKRSLKIILEEELKKFTTNITRSAEDVFKQFNLSISQSLKDFERQIIELQNIHSQFNGKQDHEGISLDIKIDNGINATAIIGTLIGGALLFWNPGGWVVIAAGIASVIVGLGKAVISFFSSSYKMKQQRKAADENIYKICSELEASASQKTDEAKDKIKIQLKETELSLKEPVNITIQIRDALEGVAKSLTELLNEVKIQTAK